MTPSMQAFRIERPGETAFIEVPRPEPGPGEVLLRVERVGFCGSDLSSFRGSNPLVSYPRIPGHEIAATVVKVPDQAAGAPRVGTPVTVVPYTACGRCAACRRGRSNACQNNQTLGVQRDGAFAEFIAVPWEKVLPAPLLASELALVEPLSVGAHAVARGRIAESDTVVVLGCGMIGLGAIAAAALGRRATVIAVDLAPEKLALARAAGAREVIAAGSESVPDRVRALTGGHGPDVVIEAVGSVVTYQLAVQLAAFAGRVVYIGYGKEPVPYETKLFVQKELDILGARNATSEDFAQVVTMLREGRYPSGATITRTVPFAEAGRALAEWAADPSSTTKIQVIAPQGR